MRTLTMTITQNRWPCAGCALLITSNGMRNRQRKRTKSLFKGARLEKATINMLILTRKPGQSFDIDGKPLTYVSPGKLQWGFDTHFVDAGDWLQLKAGVRVKYIGSYKARPGQARFGFEAPRSVSIVRDDAKKVVA